MGVLQPRGRRDSRASALSRRNWGFDREPGLSMPEESLVEHATLGSSPAAGVESSSYNGTSLRTPSRSFYHRSFNTAAGGLPTATFVSPRNMILGQRAIY